MPLYIFKQVIATRWKRVTASHLPSSNPSLVQDQKQQDLEEGSIVYKDGLPVLEILFHFSEPTKQLSIPEVLTHHLVQQKQTFVS